jgi:aminopeptidase N
MELLRRSGVVLLVVLIATTNAHAAPVEAGVSRTLALSRAARVSDLRYEVEFHLTGHASTIAGVERLSFSDSGGEDLALDYRDAIISNAALNGKEIPASLVNGHLSLPAGALVKGRNELKLSFVSNVAAAGKAFTRYEDRDDHNEYLYTLFVPMDASMAFPCFDQPDLKARFTLKVSHPSNWRVIANTAPSAITLNGLGGETTFAETRPISTYLFAFAAGPFEELPGKASGEPTVWVRKSQLARAKTEAPEVQQMAARGIKYLSDYFAQPFPFPKYDLVLIPGFPFGGMEHAGATFLNEDGVLFRTAPTESDYFRRNILVLHETCHQWFGDLVTMRWFDDLWLKEGFAQYMAYKALAELEPAQNPWKHFYEDIKPLAYGIDETQGTTPIFQNIVNLKDAKSAYGAIVYQKAPAVLKELDYFLGDQNFRDGLRLYLKEHAYGNAQWADLIHAFEATGNKNVQQWAKAWILQRGMPQVSVSFMCRAGRISKLTLSQEDVLQAGYTWPISNEVLLDAGAGGSSSLRADWSAKTFQVREAVGRRCPAVVFANRGDFGYGRFLLDAASEKTVSQHVVEASADKGDPLLRSMLWGALWEKVHVAQTAPARYVDLALKALPGETDESLARIQGARIATALHSYMSEKGRAIYAARIEAVASERMLAAPTLNLRIVNFRTFTSVAETPMALRQMKALLDGSLNIAGMPLKPLDRWNLIGHLMAMSDPDAAALFATAKSKDQSGEGQKYAYAIEAGTADVAAKARYFEEYVHSADRQEDWITQSLRPFNSWNQTDLTAPYLGRALDALVEIKQRRKIFFLGAWLGAFIEGQHSPEAKAVVHEWLERSEIDPDLRLKVLEASDALNRTVMIRAKFPD